MIAHKLTVTIGEQERMFFTNAADSFEATGNVRSYMDANGLKGSIVKCAPNPKITIVDAVPETDSVIPVNGGIDKELGF